MLCCAVSSCVELCCVVFSCGVGYACVECNKWLGTARNKDGVDVGAKAVSCMSFEYVQLVFFLAWRLAM